MAATGFSGRDPEEAWDRRLIELGEVPETQELNKLLGHLWKAVESSGVAREFLD